jgi:EmrB/QacA subfamily drug resistance transporter
MIHPGTVSGPPGERGHEPGHEPGQPSPAPRGAGRGWAPLIILCAAQFMVLLDMTVTTIALPTIGRSLGFAAGDLPWVITSYLLATGGLTLLGGRVADLFGGRRTFAIGLAAFTLASLASGLAPTAAALLTARAVQGVSAALLTPSALGLLTATYDGARRATALSVWGGLAGGGVALGTVLGGVLTSWLGWRSVFLINVPVGVAALAAAWHSGIGSGGTSPSFGLTTSAPEARESGRGRLDLRGAILSAGGLAALAYAISRQGWGPSRVVPLAAAVVLLAAFALAERLAERSGRHPLVPLSIFRTRGLTPGALALLAATGLQVGVVLLSSLFLQDVTGASALRAGVEFLPPVLLTGLGAGLGAHLMGKTGSRPLAVAGFALLATGAFLLSRVTAGSGYAGGLLPGLLVLGAGSGLAFPSAQVTGLSAVRAQVAGLAAGLMSTGHELGAALGSAIFPALAASAVSAGFIGGYRHAMLIVAVTAAVLALLAVVALPNARPAPGTKVGLH